MEVGEVPGESGKSFCERGDSVCGEGQNVLDRRPFRRSMSACRSGLGPITVP